MTYTPTVRQPTGIPAAPLIMVTGGAKSGKSMTAYKLGQSDRIDNVWVADLGEGSADEYADVGGYQVLDWGKSWSDLADSVAWCIAQPVAAGRLNGVIIDSGTEMWESLKDRASDRARNSSKNRKALQADPDAEIEVTVNYWNEAAATWAKIVNPLKTAGHIVGVILVRSDEVAEVVNGAPTRNRVTSLQAHKTLPGVVTAHVQIRPDHSAHLVEVRSSRVSVPVRGLALGDNALGEVLELLAPSGVFAAPEARKPIDDERPERDETPADPPEVVAAKALIDRVRALSPDQVEAFKAWKSHEPDPTKRVVVADLAADAPWRAALAEGLDYLEGLPRVTTPPVPGAEYGDVGAFVRETETGMTNESLPLESDTQ